MVMMVLGRLTFIGKYKRKIKEIWKAEKEAAGEAEEEVEEERKVTRRMRPQDIGLYEAALESSKER